MPGFDLASCLGQLADRNPGRTEADIQADVREVLLFGGFDLGEEHVRLESPAPDRRCIDVKVDALVIECKRDLRPGRVLQDAERQGAVFERAYGRAVRDRQGHADVHLEEPQSEALGGRDLQGLYRSELRGEARRRYWPLPPPIRMGDHLQFRREDPGPNLDRTQPSLPMNPDRQGP